MQNCESVEALSLLPVNLDQSNTRTNFDSIATGNPRSQRTSPMNIVPTTIDEMRQLMALKTAAPVYAKTQAVLVILMERKVGYSRSLE